MIIKILKNNQCNSSKFHKIKKIETTSSPYLFFIEMPIRSLGNIFK